MMSNMFFKLVTSQLDSDLTATVKKNISNAAQKSIIIVVVFTIY